MKALVEKGVAGQVYCPICTHTVAATIDMNGKRAKVTPGQVSPLLLLARRSCCRTAPEAA